jgi:hypothetical protein
MANGNHWLPLFYNYKSVRFLVLNLEKKERFLILDLLFRQLSLYLHPQKRPRGATE